MSSFNSLNPPHHHVYKYFNYLYNNLYRREIIEIVHDHQRERERGIFDEDIDPIIAPDFMLLIRISFLALVSVPLASLSIY